MQPGQTIAPQSETPETSTPVAPNPTVVQQQDMATNPSSPTAEQLPPAVVLSPDLAPATASSDEVSVSWTASEYIAHDKNISWFVILGAGLFVLVGLGYFLTRSIFATVLLASAGLSFGIFSVRPPRVLQYQILDSGILIGEKLFPFSELKSFTIHDETAVPSVMLMPLKRFMPPITIFYDPQTEDLIINALSDHLPHEDRAPDLVDRLMSRIRF